jgi:hypothetical protein
MKKNFFYLSFCVFLLSCGNKELENDAKELADLQCQAQELQKNTDLDESSITEAEDLGKEIAELSQEIGQKYTDPSDLQDFQEELTKKMKECNNF